MKQTSKYVFFWRTIDYMSNWYHSPFSDGCNTFENSEQYFIWRKAVAFGDTEIAQQVLLTSDPDAVKKLGRKVKGFDEEIWIKEREPAMYDANYFKFTQHPELAAKLIATGDLILVEASPYDKIWGVGLEENDSRIVNPANWDGLNLLGECLMKVRSTLNNELISSAP